MKEFPLPPSILLTEENIQTVPDKGFLRVIRSEVTFHYPDETKSKPCIVDRISRKCEDAVVMIIYFYDAEEVLYVYLRSAIRPAIALRKDEFFLSEKKNLFSKPNQLIDCSNEGNLWELPAGLIENEENTYDGVKKAAARETLEEIGFDVNANNFSWLGKRSFPSVGLSGERLFFLSADVTNMKRVEPCLDGSPFESHGEVIAIPLSDAIKAIDNGYLVDMKTEVGLRRLENKLGNK